MTRNTNLSQMDIMVALAGATVSRPENKGVKREMKKKTARARQFHLTSLCFLPVRSEECWTTDCVWPRYSNDCPVGLT